MQTSPKQSPLPELIITAGARTSCATPSAASVAAARGNARLLCHWRRRGAETGTREDAVG